MSGGPGYHGWTHRPASDGGTDPIPLPLPGLDGRAYWATREDDDQTISAHATNMTLIELNNMSISTQFDDGTDHFYIPSSGSKQYWVNYTPGSIEPGRAWILKGAILFDAGGAGSGNVGVGIRVFGGALGVTAITIDAITMAYYNGDATYITVPHIAMNHSGYAALYAYNNTGADVVVTVGTGSMGATGLSGVRIGGEVWDAAQEAHIDNTYDWDFSPEYS